MESKGCKAITHFESLSEWLQFNFLSKLKVPDKVDVVADTKGAANQFRDHRPLGVRPALMSPFTH